jgi:hypothetical protein
MQFGFGSGVMFAVRKDVANATPVRFGAMQNVSIDFSGDTKMLYSQAQYPIDVARGKVKISGKAQIAQISAAIFNTIFFGGTLAAGQTLISYNESITIATVVAAANAGAAFVDDLGPQFQAQTNGSNSGPLTLVASSPAAGQYSVSNGTYTFASGDAAKLAYLNYSYTVTTGMTVTGGNPFMGNTPYFTAEFSDTFEGGNITLKLYRCVGTSISLPTKIDDFYVSDFAFDAFADASNNTFLFTTT